MTHKEELELAAKAIGLDIRWIFPVDGDLHSPKESHPSFKNIEYYPSYIDDEGFSVRWNPEHNSGDAFELSLYLNMNVENRDIKDPHSASKVTLPCGICVTEDYRQNPIAATRRAIFKAAVEYGKRI